METIEETGLLEKALADGAHQNMVSANVFADGGVVYAEISSGHAGVVVLEREPGRCRIICSASSLVDGGNSRIKNSLADARISSDIVPAGADGKSQKVRFETEYFRLERALDAVFTAYKDITPGVV